MYKLVVSSFHTFPYYVFISRLHTHKIIRLLSPSVLIARELKKKKILISKQHNYLHKKHKQIYTETIRTNKF